MIPSYRKVLLDEIENSREILSFDRFDFKLKPFFWYVFLCWLSRRLITRGQACGWQQTRDARYVARVSHAIQIPRAVLFVSTPADGWRRTPIYRSRNPAQGLRDHIGEYVAECPNGRCEYLGQLPVAFQDKESLTRREKIVSLEQKYALYGIPVKTHAPRGRLFHRKASRHVRWAYIEVANIVSPEPSSPSLAVGRWNEPTQWLVSKMSYAEKTDCRPLDLTDSSMTIPRATKWTKFSKLDRMKKPGLSEAEFWGLFIKCDNYQKITMRGVFRYHLEDCEGHQHIRTIVESHRELCGWYIFVTRWHFNVNSGLRKGS